MMKNITINVSRETRMVYLSRYVFGNDGENLQGNFSFKFNDEFVDGTARLEYIIGGKKKYLILMKGENEYTVPIKSVLTKEGKIMMQLVITEGTDPDEIPIFKSNVFEVRCNASINAEIEAKEEYPTWIEIANTKLNEIDLAIAQALNVDINAYKEGNVSTITIKNQLGETKQVNVFDGEKGVDGYTPQKGIDYFDGKDGLDGIDGYTPVKGVDYFDGKDGATGPQGIPGVAGKDAKINGVNALNIIEGTNIKLEQTGSTLKINSTGGGSSYDDTELREKINKVDEDLGITQQDVQELKNDVDNIEENYLTNEEFSNQIYNYVKEGLVNNTNQLSDDEQLKIETWLGLAHNYLTYYNETPYTVTSDYVPAHKKYVDSKIGDIDTILQDINSGGGVE